MQETISEGRREKERRRTRPENKPSLQGRVSFRAEGGDCGVSGDLHAREFTGRSLRLRGPVRLELYSRRSCVRKSACRLPL